MNTHAHIYIYTVCTYNARMQIKCLHAPHAHARLYRTVYKHIMNVFFLFSSSSSSSSFFSFLFLLLHRLLDDYMT